MRIAYFGTPHMAVAPLEALVAAGHDIALVVTGADKRRGRGSTTSPSPVKAAALERGLAVSHEPLDALALEPPAELGVVVAYGRIIRPPLLGAMPLINLHFSLLPRWRGAAPVERAILAGDTETGVCVMEVAEGLDTGGVYRQVTVPIGADQTADELRSDLVAAGADLLVAALADGLEGLGSPMPQAGEPTYAAKVTTEDFRLDWNAPTAVLHRQVRVGGAWTTANGKRLKVWRTAVEPTGDGVVVPTGDGTLELLEVQPEGKSRMAAKAWANGVRWSDDDRLGS